MDTISLVAKPDHILKLAGIADPARALIELVWNGLDAEASKIAIRFEYDGMDGISRVIVEDDGHGMDRQACGTDFSMLGGSWKAGALVSPNIKRRLQGRNGQGRLRAFALGNDVEWRTIADAVAGGRHQTIIRGSASNPVSFTISDAGICAPSEPTGTVFESTNPARYVNRLSRDETTTKLVAAFALFLLANPTVSIALNGAALSPESAWIDNFRVELPVPTEDSSVPVLHIIEWRNEVPRTLSLCDASGNELAQQAPGIQVPGYSFTAYIQWDGFKNHLDTLAIADFQDGPIEAVLSAARDAIKSHFQNREFSRRQRQIKEWKDQEVYPYSEDPETALEIAERGLFDEVATTVARKLPRAPDGRRTSLRLLKEIVASDPDKVLPVVDQFFGLPKREQEQMRNLLEGTSLSAIIRATNDVSERFKFLVGLKAMVFNPTLRKLVKERAELHKMLARETWVFGDEYSLMASDRSLDTVLTRHLEKLGKKAETTRTNPVRREGGQRGIVDLVLGRSSRSSGGRREHLVVELKAPKVKIGTKESAQIQEYAEAVTSDPQFNKTDVTWNFWVVSTELTSVVRKEADSTKAPRGCISSWDNGVQIWAKTWGEIVEECEARLNYYRECLDYEASQTEALDYFRRIHADVAPPSLMAQKEISA